MTITTAGRHRLMSNSPEEFSAGPEVAPRGDEGSSVVALANGKTGRTEYSVSHIVLAERLEAEWVIAALHRGADFSRLAERCSIDRSSSKKRGSLGWISDDNCDRAIVAAAARLSVRTWSAEPVRTRLGWHVLRLEEVRG